MTERWFISPILLYDNVLASRWKPAIPADLSGCHAFSCSLASGVRLPVIWCGTGVRFHRVQYPQTFFFPPAWILMRPHADKSNMSSAVLMYTHVSESPCPSRPVWTPQNLIYDWQLIWKSQNTPAWPSERDSVDEKQLSPDSSPSRQSGPVAQRLSASIRFLPPPLPQKTH